jgi:hypothetical protein
MANNLPLWEGYHGQQLGSPDSLETQLEGHYLPARASPKNCWPI